MNDKEILAGAPEGAVCVDAGNDYFNEHGVMWAEHCKCFDFHDRPEIPCRSLADIARIAELEKERDELSAFKVIFGMGDGESVVTARQYINSLKLEQQAKGIDWVLACRELNLSEGEVHTLMDKCKQLREGVTND